MCMREVIHSYRCAESSSNIALERRRLSIECRFYQSVFIVRCVGEFSLGKIVKFINFIYYSVPSES